jgi:DNA repair protein RecN (Recombination protein N)
MLKSIAIKNIVLIDALNIDLANNFCVLSGQTGSGKSILLDALGLVIGYRSSSRLLKKDAKEGVVSAEFDISCNQNCQEILQENGLLNSQDNLLILRRVLNQNGSRAFVNDIAVGVALLKKIGDSLVEIHGQNEQSNLLTPAFHGKILDQYAKNADIFAKMHHVFDDLSVVKKQLNNLYQQKEENAKEKDYLQHIIKELENADIQIGEEEDLTKKRHLLNNQEKVANLTADILQNINDSDSKIIESVRFLNRGQNLADLLPDASEKILALNEILDEIAVKNDNAREQIDEINSFIDVGGLNLSEIEERLFYLKSLARKFATNIDNLSQFLEESQEKLKIVDNFSILAEDLEQKQQDLEKEFLNYAQKIRQIRQSAAAKLTNKIEQELSFIKMAGVKFVVQMNNLPEGEYRRDGIDSIKFAAATNSNSNLDDISKIASGGELSRFMLAIKVALLDVQSVPILIFDEIDSGIGGAVAGAVGARLKLLSEKLQILVVTHHPQIAAKAGRHFKVEKTTQNENTATKVTQLNNDKAQIEVARMLAAEEITPEAMAAARKLMEG